MRNLWSKNLPRPSLSTHTTNPPRKVLLRCISAPDLALVWRIACRCPFVRRSADRAEAFGSQSLRGSLVSPSLEQVSPSPTYTTWAHLPVLCEQVKGGVCPGLQMRCFGPTPPHSPPFSTCSRQIWSSCLFPKDVHRRPEGQSASEAQLWKQ